MASDDWVSYEVPLHDFIGLTVEQLEPHGIVTMPLTPAIKGSVAPIHGGMIATVADVACGAAIGYTFDPEVEYPVSIDLNVRFYGQPKSGPIRAEAEVVHRGSRIIGCECVVRDGDGRQLARMTGTYMIVKGYGSLGTSSSAGEGPR